MIEGAPASPSHARPQFWTVALRSVRRSLSLRLNPEPGVVSARTPCRSPPYDGFDASVSVVWSAFPVYQPYADAFADVVPHLTIGALRPASAPRGRKRRRDLLADHRIDTHCPRLRRLRCPGAWQTAPSCGRPAPWVDQVEGERFVRGRLGMKPGNERVSAKREGHLPRSAIVPS
jgi:hypothetical protein